MALDKWKKLIGGEDDNTTEGEESYYSVTKEEYSETNGEKEEKDGHNENNGEKIKK